MSEEFSAHQVVGLNCQFNVIFMNSQGNSHEHMLGSFYNFSIDFEKVSSFKSFEAKEIESKVPLKVNGFVDFLVMLMNDLVNPVREKGSFSSTLVFTVVELIGDVEDGGVGFFPEIID